MVPSNDATASSSSTAPVNQPPHASTSPLQAGAFESGGDTPTSPEKTPDPIIGTIGDVPDTQCQQSPVKAESTSAFTADVFQKQQALGFGPPLSDEQAAALGSDVKKDSEAIHK